jgi:CheY-like chemotaxis protein
MDTDHDFGGARCSVLLAEDRPSNVELAVQVLDLLGCDVTVVPNGAEAVQAVRQRTFDLVLMDFHMPVMNGLEAAGAIRAWEAREGREPLLIVGLTASAMPQEVRQCLSAGMNEVITKPFAIPDLRQLVVRACPMLG